MTLRPALCLLAVVSGLILPSGPLWAEDWEPVIYPEQQIFPSMLVSTATAGVPEDADETWDCPIIGDASGLIGALVDRAKKGDVLRVVVHGNELMEESAFEGRAKKSSDQLLVLPKIKYRFGALARVNQQQPLNVTMEVWRNGESLGEQTVTADVRPINDCLFGVVDDEGGLEFDAMWNFASYVNENHPWVDEILRDALETKVVDSFTGYQSGEPEEVLLQIYAVWNVMQRRGLRYSDITTTAIESDTVLSQHVRLLDQSITAKQANCVDGTVLLASVLRKIGLDCQLALVPGHMFLVVNLDDESPIGVETTMMGNDDLGEFDELTNISRKKRELLRNQKSFATFEAAVGTGTQALEEAWEKFDGDDFDYTLVDVAEARRQGILPIGYVK